MPHQLTSLSCLFKILISSQLLIFTLGCSSSGVKQRKEQRDKVAQSSKFYCEFLNAEQFPDIDVAINLEVAKRCDTTLPMQMFPYKTPTEVSGVMYCCNTNASAARPTKKGENPAAPAKSSKDKEVSE